MNYGFVKVAAAVPLVQVADCFYNIEKIEDKWTVYYSERGVKTTNEIFKSEKEACQYIYNQLID